MRVAPRALVAVAVMGCAVDPAGSSTDFDLLIRGGTVVDGSGGPRYRADVALLGDRIVRIDSNGIDAPDGVKVLDAQDLIVAPGFIDNHAHIQTSIHEYPLAENFLWQGITSIMATLHSGNQPWPMDAYAASLDVAPNVGFFAGHTWTRRQVLGMENRAPTPEELDEMRELVAESMRQGAIGFTTGLLYVPANFAEPEEVIELAKVASRFGGVYVSHMRDEGRGLIDAVAEVIRVADEADIPAQIQHHKAMGPGQFGWSEITLRMIDSANAAGLDVKHDLYPYTAGSTGSGVLFPPWALAGGADSLRARLDDPVLRDSVIAGMRDRMIHEWTGDDLARIQFRELYSDARYDGLTMADLARDRGLPNTVESGIQLAIELQLAGGFSAIYHVMDEADVQRIMQHPLAMFQTDGDPVGYGEGFPHPRSYGAFPRVLARYVRDLNVLTLENAVHRMTAMPADQMGQPDRGRLVEGAFADVVVFDPETIQDLATFTDPHRYSVGMHHVIVNGIPVIENQSLTGERPGRVLTGPARRR